MADASVIEEIILLMLVRGIDLENYYDPNKYKTSWGGNPRGFKFELKHGIDDYIDFLGALKAKDSKFASESNFGHYLQKGYAFREVSNTSSIHVILRYGSPEDNLGKMWYSNIHVDSVGICSTRDKCNRCNYDYHKLPSHIVKDLKPQRKLSKVPIVGPLFK